MTRARTPALALVGAGLLAAALAVPSPAGASTGLRVGSTSVAAALPPLGPGDWTAARNKPAGGGWNQAETTIGPANAASLHVVRSYAGPVNAGGGQAGATGHGLFYSGTASGGLAAYDASSGARRWSASTGSAMVAVGDTAVYTVSGADGQGLTGPPGVTAYAAGTGAELWHVAIPNLLSIASPTLVGSRVLVAYNAKVASKAPSFVASFDAATGRKVWQRKLPLAGGADWPYRVSAVSALAGTGVVTIADGAALALDLSTGRILWTVNLGGLAASIVQSRPVIRGTTVYVGLFDDRQQGFVKALRLGSGAQVWSRPLPAPPFGGLAEADGVVYVQADVEGSPGTPDTFALSSATGAVIWSRVGGAGALPPTVANGVLYLVELVPNFAFHTYNAATGAPLGSLATSTDTWSEPMVSHGRVYLLQSDGPILVLAP